MHLLASSFWEHIEKADQWLFIQINSVMTNRVFDEILPFMRESNHWIPLYLFLIVFALLNFKGKGAWWIVFFIVTVSLTDLIGNYGFKHNFNRLRPCNDPDFFMHVRLLVDHCSTGFSFTSNHAANHFGMGTFFYVTTRHWLKKWSLIGWVWAGLISYAQIYVGVHYPLDILGGALLGLLIGTFTGSMYNNRFGIAIFGTQPTVSS